MTIRYVEVRSGSWNGGADLMIQRLKSSGVQQGQLIWIDAHNNGLGLEAIFSAFWDDAIKGEGALDIAYHSQNADYSWSTFYAKASEFVANIHPKNLISMTASCNYDQYGVLYVFYYNRPISTSYQYIRWCEARANSWDEGAKQILFKMKQNGAKAGQVISIDAHNNGEEGDAIFSAWWNASLPVTGELGNTIQFRDRNDTTSWNDHYQWGSYTANSPNGHLNIHSITSCSNHNGNGVTYIFQEDGEFHWHNWHKSFTLL